MLVLLVSELLKRIPSVAAPVVVTFPEQVILVVIPPDGQSVAKLLKLKSKAAQNKKHWGKLGIFLI
jgi:hypothetical protein